MCTLSVSNVIYHKFSHGAAFYTLNGKNINVMLEYSFLFERVLIIHMAYKVCQKYNNLVLLSIWSFVSLFIRLSVSPFVQKKYIVVVYVCILLL